MRTVNWFVFFLYMVMSIVVGFLVFDNIASSLIFGIVVGGILSFIFATNKIPK